MRRAGYVTAAGVLAADQATKALAVSGVIPARLVRNTGASFGVGAGHPLVILLTAVAVTAVTGVWFDGIEDQRPGRGDGHLRPGR